MFCEKCGTENENGTKFCKECGHELNGAVNQSSGKDKRHSKSLMFGALGGAIIVLIIIICLVASRKTTINLDKYVKIEISGYEGYGEAYAEIDWDAIERDSEKVAFESKAKKMYGGFLEYMTPADVLMDLIDVQFSEDEYLSNGDKIEYTWEIEDDLSLYLDCKILSKGGTYEVTSLEEIETFDAFDDLEVYFDGIAPNGRVYYEYLGDQFSDYDFSCTQSGNLKNGDKVTISIAERDMEYYANEFGKVPSRLEKEYVVSGLQEYVDTYMKLSSDFISTLKNEAEDTIYAYIATDYSSESKMSNLEYVGYIFNFVTDSEGHYDYKNNVYFIYRGIVSHSEKRFDTTMVYYPVRFGNILSSKSGFSYESNLGIEGSSQFGTAYYYTDGYINPLDCYIDIVEKKSYSHSIELGDGFEAYAEYELITYLNDISSEYKKILLEDAFARIEKKVASYYEGAYTTSNMQGLGEYLLVAKNQGTNFADDVKLIIVCTATVSCNRGWFEPTTVYFPVEYDGVVKLPGDEYMYTSVKGIMGKTPLVGEWSYYMDGYVEGEEMFSELITANRDNYKYEVSPGLIQFGE